MSLNERLVWVQEHRGLSDREWSRAAGYADNYVAVLRARHLESGVLPAKTARRLAEPAKVSELWLRDGDGDPEPGTPTAVVSPPPPTMVNTVSQTPTMRALLRAYRASNATEDDLLDALSTAQGIDLDDPSAARWLRAVRAVRARSETPTTALVARELARKPDAAA